MTGRQPHDLLFGTVRLSVLTSDLAEPAQILGKQVTVGPSIVGHGSFIFFGGSAPHCVGLVHSEVTIGEEADPEGRLD